MKVEGSDGGGGRGSLSSAHGDVPIAMKRSPNGNVYEGDEPNPKRPHAVEFGSSDPKPKRQVESDGDDHQSGKSRRLVSLEAGSESDGVVAP